MRSVPFSFWFCCLLVAGLARSEALRSPKGGALRAKRRARPTTVASRRRPTSRLASAPRGGWPVGRVEHPWWAGRLGAASLSGFGKGCGFSSAHGRKAPLSQSGQGRVERDSVAPQASALPAGPIFLNPLPVRYFSNWTLSLTVPH